MQYDAITFLNSLFEIPRELTPTDLPLDWYLEWDERAAIMECDGNMPRESAEHFAVLDIFKQMKRASCSITTK
jgi:hypothetical protein